MAEFGAREPQEKRPSLTGKHDAAAGDHAHAPLWAGANASTPTVTNILTLQRHAGNRAVTRLLSAQNGPRPIRGDDPPTIQRVEIEGVSYVRDRGGVVVGNPEAHPFPSPQPGPAPIDKAGGLIGVVANVPTIGNISQVAGSYAQGWKSPEDRSERQRLVIGVNTFQSLGESEADALARVRLKVDAVDEHSVGTALLFVWRPKWKVNGVLTWPAAPLNLTEEHKAQERKEALVKQDAKKPDESMVPYGLIRSTILASGPTSTYAAAFATAGYEPYVHVGDPDASSLKVPQDKGRPTADQAGGFAQESTDVLFDRLQQLIEKRRTVKAKGFASVVAGGYQLRGSSKPGDKIPLSEIASQVDMQVRRVLFSKGTTGATGAPIRGTPAAAYLPEPNLLVRWSDIPKSEGVDAAKPDLFGGEKSESPTLMRNLVEALQTKGVSLADIRRRVAFKPAAAIGTGATGAGERFLVSSERSQAAATAHGLSRDAAPADVKEAYGQILRSGQSHANPNTWAEKALKAAGVVPPENVPNAGKMRVGNLAYAQQCLRTAADNAGNAKDLIISALKSPDSGMNNLSADQKRKLTDLANQTVAVIASYEAAIAAALK